ncbi:MAG: hypothetical protein E6I23_13550 [Chloroflexi bacterium]|nr:MAG: hypothetical protein E6I23_13550 [Chloroflexota bacterium]
MVRRPKARIGDVFQIPLDSGRVCYGQVVAVNSGPGPLYVVVFHRVWPLDAKPDMTAIVTDEIALVAPTLDALIWHGKWPVVGNRTPDLNRVPFPAYRITVGSADNWFVETFDFRRRRLPEPGELEKLTNPFSVAPIRLQKAIGAINGLEPWDPTWDQLTYASVLARCIVV